MAGTAFYLSGLPTAMAFILFHSLFYLPGILPFLFRRFRPIQPCDLLGNYFAAKVTDSPSLWPMPASRRRGEPGKIFLSAVERIFPSSLGRVFLPTFRSRKIIPGGRKQAEQREEK